MHLTDRVEVNWSGWAFGQGPEGSAILVQLVYWIDMQELKDIIHEVFLELGARKFDAVLKSLRVLHGKLDHFLDSLLFLLVSKVDLSVLLIDNKFIE